MAVTFPCWLIKCWSDVCQAVHVDKNRLIISEWSEKKNGKSARQMWIPAIGVHPQTALAIGTLISMNEITWSEDGLVHAQPRQFQSSAILRIESAAELKRLALNTQPVNI